MKKYFIFAIAALAASAACSNVETLDTPKDTLIGFNVVKYAAKTRAYNSLLDEFYYQGADTTMIESFTTNAWFHDGAAAYGPQQFMSDQTIAPDDASDPSYWSPSGRNYYWPKTGYINFFSYAGSPVPTAKAENSLTYANVSVVPGSNILVADAAYRYSANNDPATYGQNSVTKGVPTLFRHILSRVKFDVVLDAKNGMANPDSLDKWTVTITSASINVPQQGTIRLTFEDPGTTETVKFDTDSVWTGLGSRTDIDKVAGDVVLTAVGGKISDTTVVEGSATGIAAELIAESSVIPHTIWVADTDSVTFTMNYTIAYQYDGGTAITEDVTVPATALKTFTPTITSWAMNTKYTYHIIIKPNGAVLFDPAVETWVEETDEPSYTVD